MSNEQGAVTNEAAKNLIEEADALAFYIARQGDRALPKESDLYDKFLESIADAKSCSSHQNCRKLKASYAKITNITYKDRGVNGRTILDSESKLSWGDIFFYRARPMSEGLCLFVLVLILEVLMEWAGNVSDPNGLVGRRYIGYYLIGTLYPFLIPAFWGGIGASVFLAKSISDKLSAKAYEKTRLRGHGTRVFLGFILGLVSVTLFSSGLDERVIDGDIPFEPSAWAFVAGLGFKPVYSAFESLSRNLARRFNGSTEKSSQ